MLRLLIYPAVYGTDPALDTEATHVIPHRQGCDFWSPVNPRSFSRKKKKQPTGSPPKPQPLSGTRDSSRVPVKNNPVPSIPRGGGGGCGRISPTASHRPLPAAGQPEGGTDGPREGRTGGGRAGQTEGGTDRPREAAPSPGGGGGEGGTTSPVKPRRPPAATGAI